MRSGTWTWTRTVKSVKRAILSNLIVIRSRGALSGRTYIFMFVLGISLILRNVFEHRRPTKPVKEQLWMKSPTRIFTAPVVFFFFLYRSIMVWFDLVLQTKSNTQGPNFEPSCTFRVRFGSIFKLFDSWPDMYRFYKHFARNK